MLYPVYAIPVFSSRQLPKAYWLMYNQAMSDIAGKNRGKKLETKRVHSLGHRAFYFFLLRRSKLMAVVVIVVGLLWYAERWVPM